MRLKSSVVLSSWGELPPAPDETNAVNEAGDEVTAGLIIDGDIEIEETEVPES